MYSLFFPNKTARDLSFPFVSSFVGCSNSASAGVDAYHEVQKQSPGGVLQKQCFQNLQKNICVGVSFLIKLQVWGVNFAKFLRTSFFIEHLR